MKIFLLVVALLFTNGLIGQKEYHLRTIVFYNVENLFDTVNDTLIIDDERTPHGVYRWTEERYKRKIGNIAKVLSSITPEASKVLPDIIGLCEVENGQVIQDLIDHPLLKTGNYGIVHSDSPDERGIDVALLYKKSAFLPVSFQSVRLLLFDEEGFRDYTRNQLVVNGLMDGEEMNFIVNHWPSRSGGEMRSRPNRIKAAQLNQRIMDSIRRLSVSAKIISMGDLNDDPIDASLKKVLRSEGKRTKMDSTKLFNPMEKIFRRGVGSLAYRDKWNLFDQFLLTHNLLSKRGYFFWKAGVFHPDWLKSRTGKYKGYPFRTYVGTTYHAGYSDHFPVYLYLVKEAED